MSRFVLVERPFVLLKYYLGLLYFYTNIFKDFYENKFIFLSYFFVLIVQTMFKYITGMEIRFLIWVFIEI